MSATVPFSRSAAAAAQKIADYAATRDLSNTPKMTLDKLCIGAFCTKVYDGDSIHVCFHYPKKSSPLVRVVVRMAGYNSAELKTADSVVVEAAKRERDFLAGLILEQPIVVVFGPYDKYGRALATVYTTAGLNVNNEMLATGHGRPYNGRGLKI